MKNLLRGLAFTLAFTLSGTAFAQSKGRVAATLKLSPAGSFVAQTANVISDFKKNPTGKPAVFAVGTIKVKIDDLKTSIALRDNHLRKHLNSAKNPYIVANRIQYANGRGKASLTLNGVSKFVSFTYKPVPTGVNYKFTIIPSEFKIEKAKYLGVGVKDEVTIEGNLNY